MQVEVTESLDSVSAEEWNRLTGPEDNPFVRHEFLAALERNDCVGPHWGWLPRHLLARDGGRLVGAVPLYEKTNSYGEFVFDWSWAEAYQRAGLRYYPKLVCGVPYTPAAGPRLLLAPDAPADAGQTLVDAALELAAERGCSSLHWLFTDETTTGLLNESGLARRTGCQFHWYNRGYRDFDDFLDGFTAQKRKKLKRERRRVTEAGIEIEVLDGHRAEPVHWETFFGFYRDTFDRHGGYATLSEAFFRELGRTLPDHVVLVLAKERGKYVAGALNLRSRDALYGRHWGCAEEYHSLHFEACYYTGIDYCIRHGLGRFEPGAQGEHKVGRGFEPTRTFSAHWVAHPGFARAVEDFVRREERAIDDYMTELRGHLPFKQGGPDA